MNKFIVLDTEAARTGVDDPRRFGVGARVYDLGYIVADASGAVYLEKRLIISDNFMNAETMRTAYYADKIPAYYAALANGEARLVTMREAWQTLKDDIRLYNVRDVWAYNAMFDRDALNSSVARASDNWITWALPYNTKWRDIMQAFNTCFYNTKKYARFCKDQADQGVNALQKNGRPRKTAELAYRYISGTTNYTEEHTALADARDELQILLKCLKHKKKLPKRFN